MPSIKELIFGKKAVPYITLLQEETREGLNKAYIPKFLYKPPFGYPRFANMSYVRYLAQVPYVEMCISTIIDYICSIPWDILPVKGMEDQDDEAEREHIRNFFKNPNTNKESFEDVFIKMPIRDLLEINSAVLNKVFNLKEEMVEVVPRDAATFTKNPDIHGMMTNRKELILPTQIVMNEGEVVNPFQQVTQFVIRNEAAYFQYGWIAGPKPVPFGKREIVWLQNMIRTDDHYGYAPIQVLAKNIQMLLYQIESELEYYNDNNVPKGIIGLEGSNAAELKAFKQMWNEKIRSEDEFGNLKKKMHKVPILNVKPIFERIEFSASEMQLIEKQKWFTKMVWASFGVTPTELGYTEDAKGQANQIVQSKVFRKKAIYPKLRLLEERYTADIVQREFGYNGKIKTKDGKEIEKPKYEFKFLVFDVDEERNKYELFKLQVESGLRTINEVRADEGLEEVEWGADPPKNWKQPDTTFNMGGNPFFNQQQNAMNPDKDTDKLQGNEDPEKTVKKTEKEIQGKEKKANPLMINEFEEPTSYKRLMKAINFVFKNNEGRIKELIEKEVSKDTMSKIKAKLKSNKECKGFEDLIKQVKALVNFDGLKGIVGEIVKNNFMRGHEEAERFVERNFIPDPGAIDFISKYTFNNVKGMTDELTTQLRSTLSRAFMDGESIKDIKARVTKVFDVGEVRAEAIARTETIRSFNTGKLLAYQGNGVKGKKKYLSVLDGKTSPLCRRLHDQEVDIRDNFTDKDWKGQSPPAHVNCRSTWMFIPEEDKKTEGKAKESLDKKKRLIDDELDVEIKTKQVKVLDMKQKLLEKLKSDK